MVFSQGLGKEIKRNPQGLESIEKSRMMTLDHALGGNPFAFCAKCNRRTMTIRAGNHQYLIAFKSVISGKYIGRQKDAGYMTNVQWAIGIRPGQANKNLFRHMASLVKTIRKKADQRSGGREVENTVLQAGQLRSTAQ